jgi:hypothetical protein
MGFFNRFFRQQKIEPVYEHAVIIHFQYGKDNLEPLYEIADRLEHILKGKNIGEYDGHEIAVDYSDGFLYLYGTNAERLFNEVKETLESTDFMARANVKLRFGPPEDGVQEIELVLGDHH